MPEHTQVSAAEIARIARVSRTTVSNWRRRHADFPAPLGGTDTRPTFDRAAVEAWLQDGDRLPDETPFDRIWSRIQAMAEGGERDRLVADLQFFLLFWIDYRRGRKSEWSEDACPLTWDEMLESGHCVGMLTGALNDAADLRKVRTGAPEPPRFFENHPEGLTELLVEMADIASTVEWAREMSECLFAVHLKERGGKNDATPAPLAGLMADLAATHEPTRRVLDPACGLGTSLLVARERGAYDVRGQEIDASLAHLANARLNLQRDGSPNLHIYLGDALLNDAYRGEVFDAVLCHPPFGQRDWGAEHLAVDERWVYGTPPRSEPELAWIQHSLAHTRPGGRVVMLLPPAVASRGSGRRLRAELLRRGALRAVIGLPPGAAQPAHIPLHLWVLEQPASADAPPPTRLLVMDTATEPEPRDSGREDTARRPIDWDDLHATVVQAWRDFTRDPEEFGTDPGRWRSVPVIELLGETVDLTPARHLPTLPPRWEPEKVLDTTTASRGRLSRMLGGVRERLPGQCWAARSPEAPWLLVSVADLLRGGALELFRTSSAAPASAEEETADGPAVLTLADVKADRPASGTLAVEESAEDHVRVAEGDVALAASLGGSSGYGARVATTEDAGAVLGRALHLLRPDPDHLDAWFLAGFLGAPSNLRQAGYGSSIIRVDPRKLRLPLLSVEEQRAYGRAFRELRAYEAEMRRVADLSGRLTAQLADGLRGGTLLPGANSSAAQDGADGGRDDRIDAREP